MGKTLKGMAGVMAVGVWLAGLECVAQTVPTLDWQLGPCVKRDGNLITVRVSDNEKRGDHFATAKVNISQYVGKELNISMKMKGKGVGKPELSWECPKLQLNFRDHLADEMHYPQAAVPEGDFSGVYTAFVPLYGMEADEAELMLGLQNNFGEVSYDLSTLKFESSCKRFPQVNKDYKVSYSGPVSTWPQLKGFLVNAPTVSEKDLADIRAWGGTLIRFGLVKYAQVLTYPEDGTPPPELVAGMMRLKNTVMPACRKLGIKICVDGYWKYPADLWKNAKTFKTYVSIWQWIASELKGCEDVIYGYDIINEPSQKVDSDWGYWGLQERCARAIREVDPVTPIVIESNESDVPRAYRYLCPLKMDNVIYEVHMYDPITFTHQYLFKHANKTVAYPNAKEKWDIAYLKKVLDPVRQFQKKHGCRIFVGEFSAAVWAPGGDEYIRDVTAIFNEYGWDWTYHAFREANCWSAEHVATSKEKVTKAEGDTPRKLILQKALRQGLPAVDGKSKEEGGNRFVRWFKRMIHK